MVKIVGTAIQMTRGDTLKALVGMKIQGGEEYRPVEGDVVRFAMKKKYSDEEELISKVIPNDTLMLHLEPQDTKELEFGKYVYDIQITYANGDVDTFIDRAVFELTEEVD